MGGGNSKYKVHPGAAGDESPPGKRTRKQKSVLKKGDASSGVINLLKSSTEMSKWRKEKSKELGQLEKGMQAGAHAIENTINSQRSKRWLEAINKPKLANPFKDPEEMFLTRPQRLRLEHIVNTGYLKKQLSEGKMSRPPPYWSIKYTDSSLVQYCDNLGFEYAHWDGPTDRASNTVELAKHEGDAFRTEDYFLTRAQRREVELAVELGFKRTMPNVRMPQVMRASKMQADISHAWFLNYLPQLSLRYTDQTALELASSIDGLLLRNIPRSVPKALKKPRPPPNMGPSSAAGFELFIR